MSARLFRSQNDQHKILNKRSLLKRNSKMVTVMMGGSWRNYPDIMICDAEKCDGLVVTSFTQEACWSRGMC